VKRRANAIGKALQTIKRAIDAHDWRAAVAALKLIFPEYRDSTQIGVQVGVSAVVRPEAEQQRLVERWDKALVALASKGGETA
jgi:hypothetical protein